jgi:hypothetical protein
MSELGRVWEEWNLNQPIDVAAAQQALANGDAEREGGSDLDPFINQAYTLFSNPAFNHINGMVTNNCKIEAQKLIDQGKTLERLTNEGPPKINSPSQ